MDAATAGASSATSADVVAYTQALESAPPDEGRVVVRVDLEAREIDWEFVPGQRTRAWAFGGQVPGPTIEAQVGDVLEIRVTNHLPEPTVVHWHGLRIPAAMDGTERVQRPVAPGESFTYRFRVQDAGTFWYHSHYNETVQMERGLYGALIVRAPDEPVFDADRTFVLDDVELAKNGEIKPPGGWIESHDGREGSVRLVNGRQEPEVRMAAGQVERWRFVNAASARYVRLSVGGRPFRIIGSGGGLIPSPVTATEVLLATANRIEIAVGPFEAGAVLRIETLPFNRGSFKSHKKPELFATVRVGAAAPSMTRIPARLREIEPLVTGPVAANRDVRLGFSLGMKHGVEFDINHQQHHHAEPVRVGELQVWDVVNRSPVHHPFHLHGFFFQVLEVNGKSPDYRSWEDTVNVPAFGKVRIAWLPDDRPGGWMYHCHILEHHAAGMMAHFEVIR
ncbi:MAG: multicopper oxidase family protein [Gemmatimonadaceae bacterium]|nr:multicopper oxidase family protein [Gemmatimonadaceae bacterium]